MSAIYSANELGTQTLSVSTVAAGPLTPPAGTNPRHALVYVGANAIRWRADGTAPTPTSGMYLAAGGYLSWTDPLVDYSALIDRAQFIRDSAAAGDATIEVAFFT